MRSISRLFIGLSLYLPFTLGAPDVPLAGRALVKRSGAVSYDENCNQPPPPSSGYKSSNKFPTREKVIEAAYLDAVTLATKAADIADDGKAFTHYFGGQKPDVQHEHFKAMMSAIKDNTDKSFTIKFECSGKAKACTRQSVAITDAGAGGKDDERVISICQSFWTSTSTKYLLHNETKGDNPGVPYRDKSADGWCGKDGGLSKKRANDFTTAGHSILHELTHLDSLAQQAGLGAPKTGEDKDRHGTLDIQTGYELIGARELLEEYKEDTEVGSPDYNAESYAAAATELYFMNLCDFKEISPKVEDEQPSTVKPPEPTPLPPPPSPYATGTCCFHLIETETCEGNSQNLWGHVKLTDGNKNLIGETEDDLGKPMNDQSPYQFASKLKNPLVITGEHRNDYVQFSINGINWKSSEPNDGGSCNVGGWDPREGPTCSSRGRYPISKPSKRQMDCCFPCDGNT